MIYKQFKDKKLSTLGYGGMRFPTKKIDGKDLIDEADAEKQVLHAYNNGVNVFDTAFFYHAGESERVLGNVLNKLPRDTWYLSDKFPGNMIDVKDDKLFLDVAWSGMENVAFDTPADIFQYQLDKCGVEYFDFYMLHNVAEGTYDFYTDEKLGIINYLLDEKKKGHIKHLGFSAHGRYETIDKFLREYGESMEFVLLQINYLDWSLQEAQKKYEVITSYDVPILAMEPVRGGKLINLGKEPEAILKAAKPDDSMAKWAFRFLQSLPNILVSVSGMSTMEQVKENLELFSKDDPMTDAEKEYVWKAVDAMASFIPCTTCRYCIDACPEKLDIPMLIASYNEASNEFEWYVREVLDALSDSEKPAACTSCGACNPLCPQDIDIPDTLKKFADLITEKTK